MVSKKNLELLEKIADFCNQASEEMEDTEDTNEILCLCDELVSKIDKLVAVAKIINCKNSIQLAW